MSPCWIDRNSYCPFAEKLAYGWLHLEQEKILFIELFLFFFFSFFFFHSNSLLSRLLICGIFSQSAVFIFSSSWLLWAKREGGLTLFLRNGRVLCFVMQISISLIFPVWSFLWSVTDSHSALFWILMTSQDITAIFCVVRLACLFLPSVKGAALRHEQILDSLWIQSWLLRPFLNILNVSTVAVV